MPVPLPLTKEERESLVAQATRRVERTACEGDQLWYIGLNILRYEATLRELEARHSPVERATDDTQRLDWLDQRGEDVKVSSGTVRCWYLQGSTTPKGEAEKRIAVSLREAIDAAMCASPTPAEEKS